MTCYNLEKYIAEAILSIFQQDYRGPMELIIVDDCSQDNSVAVIKETIAEHANGWDVTLVENERNLGVSGACDQGCKRAKYEWLVMADGDDIHSQNRCSLTAEIIARHPDAAMVMGSASHADKNGHVYGYQGYSWETYENLSAVSVLETSAERGESLMLPDGFPKWRFFGGCMALNREKTYTNWGDLVKEADGERFAQDPVFAIRAFLSGPVVAYREPACKYRSHETNMLNRSWEWEKLSAWFSMERHMQGFLRLSWRNVLSQLREVEAARQTPGMSDFSEAELNALHRYFTVFVAQYEILAHWWEYSWFKRLRIALHNPLPQNFRKWPIPRLLPFSLYVTLRWFVHQKLRK